MGLNQLSCTVEGELHLLDVVHDLAVVFAIEGRGCRHEDVENHSCRPDVASLVIIQLHHLRSDVIGSADELVLLLGN